MNKERSKSREHVRIPRKKFKEREGIAEYVVVEFSRDPLCARRRR